MIHALKAMTSTETEQECEGCLRLRPCRLYVLQDGHAAFVCRECREGKKR